MSNSLTSDDPRYSEMFDVEKETRASGSQVFGDLSGQMSQLREKGLVQKGSLHDLLELPKSDHEQYTTPRQHYTLFSFNACDKAFRENLLFSSAVYKESPGVSSFGDVILTMTGKKHMNYRSVVQPMFIRPQAISHWRPKWIVGAVDSLLNRIENNETADLNMDLCARLPVHIVTEGIGMSGSKALEFREHLLNSMAHARTSSREDLAHASGEVTRMLNELIDTRRKDPQDDVVSGLIKGDLLTEEGSKRKLSNEEIAAYCRLIMLAGGGTTWRQLGITLMILLSNYPLWKACQENRDLIEPAIEEGARWLPTDPTFPRLVMEDTELEGVTIPAGCRVDLCLSAANRDPSRWEHAEQYDLYRPRKSHLGFGMGPHRCLGMEVAKQEMLTAINELMNRFPNMRLDGQAPPAELLGGLHQRGYSSVPVRFNK